MKETYNLNKTSWFVNPWFDIIFLASFPIALIISLIWHFYIYIPQFPIYKYTLFNFPHVISGFSVVYLAQQEYKRRPILFLIIPFIIFIATFISYTLGYSLQMETIRFYWGHWHVFIQYYYILQFYKLRNQDYLRTDRIIDTLALIIGFIFLSFYYLCSLLEVKFGIKTIYVIPIGDVRYLLKYLAILGISILITFILRQTYLFIRWKKFYPFKILMVFMVILIYCYPLMRMKDVLVASAAIITLHSIQYIAWTWLYCCKKFKEGIAKEAKVISYLSQPGRAGLYFSFLYLISIIFNFFLVNKEGLIYYNAVTLAFAFNHFYLDGKIWKIPKVRSVFNV